MADATEAKIDATMAEVTAEQAAAVVAAKPARTVKKKAATKPAPRKAAKRAEPKIAAKKPAPNFKDSIMAKTQNVAEELTAKVQEAMTEAQERAKLAFEKSQVLAGEAGEFTKGNVEAVVESGKVLAAAMQDMGKDYVAEAKSAFETVQADLRELAAVKSPADFFKLQGEILRRNFDAVVASGSKNSEKAVKLANEAFAPIQNRVSLAIEKVKQAA